MALIVVAGSRVVDTVVAVVDSFDMGQACLLAEESAGLGVVHSGSAAGPYSEEEVASGKALVVENYCWEGDSSKMVEWEDACDASFLVPTLPSLPRNHPLPLHHSNIQASWASRIPSHHLYQYHHL